MLKAVSALLSIASTLLTLFQEHRLKEQGRREAMEQYRLKALEAKEKALEIDQRDTPTDKRSILDRM